MFSQSRLGHQAAVLKQVRHSVFSVQVLSLLGIGIAWHFNVKKGIQTFRKRQFGILRVWIRSGADLWGFS